MRLNTSPTKTVGEYLMEECIMITKKHFEKYTKIVLLEVSF